MIKNYQILVQADDDEDDDVDDGKLSNLGPG